VVRDVYGVDVGPGFDVVGEARTGEETIEVVRSAQPDLLLLDMSMPRLSGLDALRALGASSGPTRTIILSGGLNKSELQMAIQLGARGVVLKDFATELLFEAMTRVLAGQSWIGQTMIGDLMDVVRDIRISRAAQRAISRSASLPGSAKCSHSSSPAARTRKLLSASRLSEETIKHHLTRMFDKVGAANRLELALAATRNGLVN